MVIHTYMAPKISSIEFPQVRYDETKQNKKKSAVKSQEKLRQTMKEEKLSVIFLFFFSPINVITYTDAEQQCETAKHSLVDW